VDVRLVASSSNENPAKPGVLQEYLTEWEPRGHDMVAAGAECWVPRSDTASRIRR
jgi:hypothetical protein